MPTQFGKYEVIEQIGEGGFGVVYRGRDPVLKRDVAIKTCALQQSDLRRRFLREAEVSARLQHPNVVAVYDYGDENGQPYMVQEFIPGEDMATVISEGWTRSTATEIDWLLQAAHGLAYAHQQGVVHRDVKPGNLRIQPDGRLRVLDFGIAKLLDSPEQLTRTGMSVGTASYLSPEQLAGQPVDHRADIFSFGSTAYELVTGRKPFAGDSLSAIIYNVAHEDPRPVAEVEPDCGPGLAAIIQGCLQKDPADRYQDFDQVIEALEAVSRGESPRTPTTDARKNGATNAGSATSAGTVAAGAGAAGASTTGGPADPGAAADPGTATNSETPADAGLPAEAAADPEEGGAVTVPAQAGTSHTTRSRRGWLGLGVAALFVAVLGVLALARWGATVPGFADRDGTSALETEATAGEVEDQAEAAGLERSEDSDRLAEGSAGDGAEGGRPGRNGANASADGDGPAGSEDGASAADAAAQGEGAVAATGTNPAPGEADAAGADPSARDDLTGAAAASGAGDPAAGGADSGAEAGAAPPTDPASGAQPAGDLRADRILVVLYGEAGMGLEEAEAVLLEGLADRDLQVLEPTGLDLSGAPTGWDPAGIGQVARSGGAGTALLATLRTEATASVPGFFTGRAVLDMRAYRTDSGTLIAAETLRVGSDQEPGELGPTAAAARSAAAEIIGRRAVRWVAERVP